jgi:membrane-associated phospholipid phosphatase
MRQPIVTERERVTTVGADPLPRVTINWGFVARGAARTVLLLLSLLTIPALYTWSPALVVLLGLPLILSFFVIRESFPTWAFYVLGFVAFVLVRARLDEVGVPWQYHYPIAADRVLGFGALPTSLLQTWFGGLYFDWFMIGVYLSYFIVPPMVAIAVWLKRDGLSTLVAATLMAYALGLVVHLFLPTAPPWLASFRGVIPHIDRIFSDLVHPAFQQTYESGQSVSQNDVAAMPSIHIAVTTLAAAALVRLRRSLLIPAVAYVALMTFSIVYLGEHYLIDAVAGALLGIGTWYLATALSPVWRRAVK